MKAVNLVPAEARRGRSASGDGRPSVSLTALGPAPFLVVLLIIVVLVVLLRVVADNDVNNKKATVAALQTRVATEQAVAARLSVYTSFVQAAQQREAQVRTIAEQRFPWKRSLDQISHVLPATTSLSSLDATTVGAAATSSTGQTVTGPTFTLAGCADTANQNGVATLLRRLTTLTGVLNVGFQSSTRSANCGNSFSLVLTYSAPGGATATATGSTSAVPAPTTTTATTTTTSATTTTATTG